MTLTTQNAAWLPHLPPEVTEQAGRQLLDSYLIALEGWRRGLGLRFHADDSPAFADIRAWFVHKPGKLFSLTHGSRTHYFYRSRGDKVGRNTVTQGTDKAAAKKILEAGKVPVPRGFIMQPSEDLKVLHTRSETLEFPLVVKSANGSFGLSVVTGLTSIDELTKAFQQLKKVYPEESIMIEEHLSGAEYRVYVVGEEVAGTIERVPANIIGDGSTAIRTLIEQKNQKRKQNPHLKYFPIIVDEEIHQMLKMQQLSLNAVLPQGQQIFLRNRSNISLGGDPIDRLEEIPESLKAAAVNALKAFPDFPHGTVDIIMSSKGPTVIEVNPTAKLGSLLYPSKGQGRDVPKAIVDYYFPETVETPCANQYYFKLHQALIPLETGAAAEVKVTPCERTTAVEGKHWLLEGDLDSLIAREKLRETAVFYRMAGFLKKKEKQQYHLYLTGALNGYVHMLAYLEETGITSHFLADAPVFVTPTFQLEETKKEKQKYTKELQSQVSLMEKQRRAKERMLHAAATLSKAPVGTWSKALRGK
ncbi:hypothetical protein [Alkalicoccus daliensis]|uniref:D-alanine-D-alanine ligase n=1 Tax=Alkalicoccus daliensis TaxID=745820 RepID=A0A1H0GIK0_9BACI|nr:hypothetical protein [Alkalicoccus daliensis]SDO06704.1 D-alanine-D-alanine ligase [Alkalicoccus daliensis]